MWGGGGVSVSVSSSFRIIIGEWYSPPNCHSVHSSGLFDVDPINTTTLTLSCQRTWSTQRKELMKRSYLTLKGSPTLVKGTTSHFAHGSRTHRREPTYTLKEQHPVGIIVNFFERKVTYKCNSDCQQEVGH